MIDKASNEVIFGRSWAEMEAMLEAALLKLTRDAPQEAPPADGIPYAHGIPNIVRQLMLMRPTGGSMPHSESATVQSTKRELDLVVRRAKALLAAVEALHKPAIDALGYREGWTTGPGGFETQLRTLVVMAQNAKPVGLQRGAGLGAKVKTQTQAIARVAACHYLGLVGRMPTVRVRDGQAYGPFVEMLDSVFQALGIEASAESQARKAIAFMEKSPLEKWPIAPLERPRKT